MSSHGPALGSTVVIDRTGAFKDLSYRRRRGTVIGAHLATDRAVIRTEMNEVTVPYDRIRDLAESPEALWTEYRAERLRQGLSYNGISKREFMAGFTAGLAA